eukprot:CAMPEP_0174252840 /NCGR_PEP_ID=MMETSP0439-20130205/2207_1 /TAXON_ID=0 /ORGANISM="Stereomyxa ramosa, Strain Chinc5" /LENGTH=359 /DNA_ID=CAMNT_0015333489 /DNA_START=17 /DNA_END=1096 /DNA_ORIENTATION=-
MEQLSAKELRARSKKIDRDLAKEKKKLENQIVLLLLGAGESGKSTIAKQMKFLHLSGYTDDERREWKKVVHTNVLASTVALIQGAESLGIPLQNTKAADEILEYCQDVTEELIDNSCLNQDEMFLSLDEEKAQTIKAVWADAGIQAAFRKRSQFQLDDSASYFITSCERLASDDYLPSDEDLLRARLRTTAVTETVWDLEGLHFRMVDVGGQRGERSKWLCYFDDVTAVLFTVGISAYDQVIREDNRTNRLIEALNLFDSVCHSEYLSGRPFILFLNKKDLFREKIKTVDLNVCFPEYKGGKNFKNAAKFIATKFSKVAKEAKCDLYTHVTIATSTDNVLKVWLCVKEIAMKAMFDDIF